MVVSTHSLSTQSESELLGKSAAAVNAIKSFDLAEGIKTQTYSIFY